MLRGCTTILCRVSPARFYCTAPKFCVGIIGAGPAGFYTAQSLMKSFTEIKKSTDTNFQIDILDRTPIGNGLVRSGVAPDHPEVKHVQNRFQELLEEYNKNETLKINFFGNIEVGRTKNQSVSSTNDMIQISLPDIQNCYHSLVFVSKIL